MKYRFYIILLSFLSCAISFSSCSDEEVTANPTEGLQKVATGMVTGAGVTVEVWAASELYAGYNKIYFAVFDSVTNKRLDDVHVHFEPVMDMHTMTHSCPMEAPAVESVNHLFPAAVLFTMPSSEMGSWSLEVSIHNHQTERTGTAMFPINVVQQTPGASLTFIDPSANKKYFLGYHFKTQPKIGVNDFEIIAYTYEGEAFVPVETLSIKLDPEMPSMEHGSPNNVNPAYSGDGHYSGKVNFTMTGEWRINLTLEDEGTAVGIKYFDIIVN